MQRQPTLAISAGRQDSAQPYAGAAGSKRISMRRHSLGLYHIATVWLHMGSTACSGLQVAVTKGKISLNPNLCRARLAHPDAVRELVARQVRRRRRRLPARGRAALGVRVAAPGQHAVVPVVPLQQRDTHLQAGQAGASAVLGHGRTHCASTKEKKLTVHTMYQLQGLLCQLPGVAAQRICATCIADDNNTCCLIVARQRSQLGTA